MKPFADNYSYLDALLTELKMRLLCAGAGLLHGETELTGFGLDSDERQLLVTPLREEPFPPGWQLRHEDLLDLQRELAALERENQMRARLTPELPLELLCRKFQLKTFERNVLLFALAFAMDSSYQHLYSVFHPKNNSSDIMGPSVRMAMKLLAGSLREGLEAVGAFSPHRPLRSQRLIACHPPFGWLRCVPLEQHLFCLEPEILLMLLGHDKDRPALELEMPEETFNSIELPAEIRERLQSLMAQFLTERGPTDRGPTERGPIDRGPTDRGPTEAGASEGGVVGGARPEAGEVWGERFGEGLVLHFGFDGGGSLFLGDRLDPASLARQLARAAGRPLLSQDASALARDDESPDAPLRALCRDAQIQGAAVLLTQIDPWLQREGAAAREALHRVLGSFGGLLFLAGWSEAASAPWPHKPLLELYRQGSGEWKLEQRMGPTVQGRVDAKRLQGLEEALALRVIGQSQATDRLVQVLRTRKAQLNALPQRPDGVFLLIGPSGVGKTETAKALNDALFGTPQTLIRLDMSEFHFRESISALIGTTPGWIGYEQGGRLTNALVRNPEAIVLLDEIEKAHPLVLDLFLQVFDEGRLTDGKGRTVDMSKATFLMTSNLGSRKFDKDHHLGFVKDRTAEDYAKELKVVLRKKLRPEFLNRIDEVLVFSPLTKEHKVAICQRLCREIQDRCARRGLWLGVESEVAPFVVEQVPERAGVRGIQKRLEGDVIRPIAELLLERREPIQRLQLSLRDGALVISNPQEAQRAEVSP